MLSVEKLKKSQKSITKSEPKKVKKSEAGKGDCPRPFSVPLDEFGKRWEKAFGKKKKQKQKQKQK